LAAPARRPLLVCESHGGAAAVLMRSAGLEHREGRHVEAVLPEWVVEVAAGTYKAGAYTRPLFSST